MAAVIQADLPRLLGGIRYEPLLRRFAVLLSAESKKCFAGSKGPEGAAWAPLKRPRRRRRDRQGRRRRRGSGDKPLRDTDVLMLSVTAGGRKHVEQITRTALVWGSDLDYADFHQDGTKTIPARPFVGVSAALLQRMERMTAEYVARELGRR
jgi:phage gpG-like protein